jgi:succinate dehydrogenase/fumarate reductase flavoprotein subunit
MWIFLKDAFLSIIDPDGAYDGSKGPVSNKLLVRGRFKGDIERVFPRAKVTVTPDRDYRYRALIPRDTVAQAMYRAVMQAGAKNFKGSVKEKWRHDAYMGCWFTMEREQTRQHAPPKIKEPDLYDYDRLDPDRDLDWTPARRRTPSGRR